MTGLAARAGTVLTPVFLASGLLAAGFLALIAVFVLLQIGGRLAGMAVPSADEFAGYCLSASSFLALGYALHKGHHIRVLIVRDRLSAGPAAWLERGVTSLALLISGLLTAETWQMVWQSYVFGDLTEGLVPLPLWLPQSGMAAGTAVLTLAVALKWLKAWSTSPEPTAPASTPRGAAVTSPSAIDG